MQYSPAPAAWYAASRNGRAIAPHFLNHRGHRDLTPFLAKRRQCKGDSVSRPNLDKTCTSDFHHFLGFTKGHKGSLNLMAEEDLQSGEGLLQGRIERLIDCVALGIDRLRGTGCHLFAGLDHRFASCEHIWEIITAATMLTILPILVISGVFQDRLIGGLTAGSGK